MKRGYKEKFKKGHRNKSLTKAGTVTIKAFGLIEGIFQMRTKKIQNELTDSFYQNWGNNLIAFFANLQLSFGTFLECEEEQRRDKRGSTLQMALA